MNFVFVLAWGKASAPTLIKRFFALGIAALAAVFVGGCCLFPSPTKCDLPPVVIDAHTHLFNAKYLPVREILVANFVKDPELARALEEFILEMTGESDFSKSSSRSVDNEVGVSPEDVKRWSTLADNQVRDDIIKRFIAPAARRIRLSSQENKKVRGFLTDLKASEVSDLPVEPEEWAQALEKARFMEDSHGGTGNSKDVAGSLVGALRFIMVTISSERRIFRVVESEYTGVTLFVHHMMEMEMTYGGQKPTFPFATQVDKMLALQRENPGRILTFGAFDPFRRKEAMALVINQYHKGVVGFKFYPPSGYRPDRNEIPSISELATPVTHWNSRYANLEGEDLDAINDEFFAWCARPEIDMPIFIHCTPVGFEASKGYGKWMCDPEYWCTVLEKYPTLRVCFGHAGGSALYTGIEPDTNDASLSAKYGRTIAELCERYPNVYCDAGFWEEVLDKKKRENMQGQLIALFAKYKNLKHRLVYGTDWYMLIRQKRHGEYLCEMASNFEHTRLKDVAPLFFAGNAARFLKLEQLSRDSRFDASTHAKLNDLVSRLPKNWKSPNSP